MKRLLFLLMTIFYCGGLLSQSCSQNNIYVSNQFWVDIFDCAEVSGNLYIREGWNESDTLWSLNGLSELTYIGGDLIIDNNSILENLSGLQSLDTIMGNLYIEENEMLENFSGLNNLKFIGGKVVIKDNDKLINFEGLNSLTYIEGGVDIGGFSVGDGNDSLINFSGLENLTFVGGTLQIRLNQALENLSGLENLTHVAVNYVDFYSTGLYLYRNSSLNNINGLTGLNTLGGWFILSNNYSLNSLSGLENLTVVDRISIHGNTNLTNIDGLQNLTTVNESISINNNTNLTNVDGLQNLTTVRSISIYDNTNLTNVDGLQNLTTVRSISIYDNTNLTNVDGLQNLTTVDSSISIHDNTNLTSINGLQNIDYTGITTLSIYSNPNLSICNVNSVCSYLESDGATNIYDNAIGCNTADEIADACGLSSPCPFGTYRFSSQQDIDDFASNYPNCTDVANIVVSQATDSLITNLNGLSQLTSIKNLAIGQNSNLINLSGLHNLTSIEERLSLYNNSSLSDLSALANVSSNLNELNVSVNHSLTSLSGLTNIIPNNILIEYNDGLTDLTGISNVSVLSGDLRLERNLGLTSLTGLESLNTVGGDVYIQGGGPSSNDYLNTLSGLNNLNSIGGYLTITSTYNLTDLTGLGNLTQIGNIQIRYNDALTDFTGLSSLNSVGGEIRIIENDDLMSLNGLNNVDYLNVTDLSIFDNRILAMCGIPSICSYLENGGTATIYNNDPGCNTETQVLQSCGLLPVEISTPLQARLQNQIAFLTWRTETETQNAGFEIQRSKDGIQWERIGWQAGQGDTTVPHSYMYTDENPLSATSYYRLKQVDFDGNFAYSNIADLHYERNTPINIYPNPVQDILYINTERPIQQALIFDVTGKSINAQMTNNSIDVSTFLKGIYTLKMTIGDSVSYQKILIQ